MTKTLHFDFIKFSPEDVSLFSHFHHSFQYMEFNSLSLEQYRKNFQLLKAKYKKKIFPFLLKEELLKSISYLQNRLDFFFFPFYETGFFLGK